MRRISVEIEGGTAELNELSARQALLMEQEGLMLAEALCAQGIPANAAKAVARNAALCAYSLMADGERRFCSAGEAADGLSLLQLADFTEQYRQAFMADTLKTLQQYDECGVNEQLAGRYPEEDTDV
ncbi:hypothetical protein [Acetanaerobacterium elongatum]|uniref:Uncharacterized protein n=1 Tax=Acetanaerobacterium elongatum TaxID=258515 RepID=A0A1H0EL74_9FIRM|nr:hypothetical protein [Acetanaerobacterium elongatum]SDN83168.1 hypothetical protein SAMN05192585_13423 [Acetanaerobacterium elongatum]